LGAAALISLVDPGEFGDVSGRGRGNRNRPLDGEVETIAPAAAGPLELTRETDRPDQGVGDALAALAVDHPAGAGRLGGEAQVESDVGNQLQRRQVDGFEEGLEVEDHGYVGFSFEADPPHADLGGLEAKAAIGADTPHGPGLGPRLAEELEVGDIGAGDG